jgi:exopolysaccharide biosynthesis predicted pyruvyltransferase EpsI
MDLIFFFIQFDSNLIENLFERMGEEKLLAELGIKIKMKIGDRHYPDIYNKALTGMKKDAVILIHGGGNFGDMWRWSTQQYLRLIKNMTEQKIIVLPQTVYYKDLKLASSDAKEFDAHKDFSITVRSEHSEKLAKEYFTKTRIINSPDAAFFISPIRPVNEPIYDFFILQRTDYESKFKRDVWSKAAAKHFNFKYSYKRDDWFDYKKENQTNKSLHYIDDFTLRTADLANKIISQGRVIITDRLHASIYSLLIGKPHVIVDEAFKKIYNTRENAFKGKPECGEEFIRASYAKDVDDAYAKAVEMLHRYY